LPAPSPRGVGILAVESVGHRHTAPAVGQVLFMNRFDGSEMLLRATLLLRYYRL
jgi:hypothetical protein